MTRWLRPVREALDAAPAPRPIFFRDDDAGWDDPALFALLDLFEHRNVPIDLAVIPTAVTPRLVRDLDRRIRHAPVRVHQHGYAHRNHQPEGRKCEFGAARTAVQQAQDIAAGRRRLTEVFGPSVDSVFTPPWNRCVPATAQLLTAQGVRVLSRDHSAVPFNLPDLVEVPVTVDWFGHRKGVRWTRDQLAQRIAQGVRDGGPVGVMLHHAVADESERAALGELLTALAAHPSAATVTIADLAGRVAGL